MRTADITFIMRTVTKLIRFGRKHNRADSKLLPARGNYETKNWLVLAD